MKKFKFFLAALVLSVSALSVSCVTEGECKDCPIALVKDLQGVWMIVPSAEVKAALPESEPVYQQMIAFKGDEIWIGQAIAGDYAYYLGIPYQCLSNDGHALAIQEKMASKDMAISTLSVERDGNGGFQLRTVYEGGEEQLSPLRRSEMEALVPDPAETEAFMQGFWADERGMVKAKGVFGIYLNGTVLERGFVLPDANLFSPFDGNFTFLFNGGHYLSWAQEFVPVPGSSHVPQASTVVLERNFGRKGVDRLNFIYDAGSSHPERHVMVRCPGVTHEVIE